MAQLNEQLTNDKAPDVAEQAQYTSLSLADGAYPFAISDGERMSGDQWAWRFLRLNPRYRYDFGLQLKERPTLLGKYTRANVAQKAEIFSEQNFQELDARYFTLHGKTLSDNCTWPELNRVSLSAALKETPNFNPDSDLEMLKVRNLSCSQEFGISYWFDPNDINLPPLGPELSWFFPFTAPTWAIGYRELKLFDPVFEFVNPKNLNQERMKKNKISLQLFCDGIKEEDEHDVDVLNKIFDRNNQNVGRRVCVGYKELECPKNTETDFKTIQQRAQMFDSDFSTVTELAFLFNINNYFPPQIENLRRVAESFQRFHRGKGLSKKLPIPPPDFKPLILSLDKTRGRSNAFKSMILSYWGESERMGGNNNFRLILLDVAYSLAGQINQLKKQLETEQRQLKDANCLPYELRGKAGNDVAGGDHWLKRALCLVEIYLRLPHTGAKRRLGAMELVRVAYDPGHDLFGIVRGRSKLPGGRSPSAFLASKRDVIDDAFDVGKMLSENAYTYLIGRNHKRI